MIDRRVLEDGSVCLSGTPGATFIYTWVSPQILLVRISGDDNGELGSRPLDEIDAALPRAAPLQLFVDTSEASGAVSAVRDAWTEWFQHRRPDLQRVSILASSKFLNLTISIAKLFSRTGELIQIYSSPELFEQALSTAAGRPVALPPKASAAPVEPAAPARTPVKSGYRRTTLADGSLRLESERCAFRYQRLRPSVLLVTISGYGQGEFGTATLDEVGAAITGIPLELFLDTRLTSGASAEVNETWGAWISAHRKHLKKLHVLASNKYVSHMLSVVKHLSRADDLIQIYTDQAQFQKVLEQAVPGFQLDPVE